MCRFALKEMEEKGRSFMTANKDIRKQKLDVILILNSKAILLILKHKALVLNTREAGGIYLIILLGMKIRRIFVVSDLSSIFNSRCFLNKI